MVLLPSAAVSSSSQPTKLPSTAQATQLPSSAELIAAVIKSECNNRAPEFSGAKKTPAACTAGHASASLSLPLSTSVSNVELTCPTVATYLGNALGLSPEEFDLSGIEASVATEANFDVDMYLAMFNGDETCVDFEENPINEK